MVQMRAILKSSPNLTFETSVVAIGAIMFFGFIIIYSLTGGGFSQLAVSFLILACVGIWMCVWTFKDQIFSNPMPPSQPKRATGESFTFRFRRRFP